MARHPRDACPWFAFYAPAWFGPTARNARRCRGCVCAGCGRRARRCPDWGDGVRPLDHCNWPSSSAGAGVPSSSASPSSPSPPSSLSSSCFFAAGSSYVGCVTLPVRAGARFDGEGAPGAERWAARERLARGTLGLEACFQVRGGAAAALALDGGFDAAAGRGAGPFADALRELRRAAQQGLVRVHAELTRRLGEGEGDAEGDVEVGCVAEVVLDGDRYSGARVTGTVAAVLGGGDGRRVRLEATGAEGTALRVAVPRAPLQLRCSVFLADALPPPPPPLGPREGDGEEDAEGPEVALEAVLRLMVWDLEGARSDPRVRGFQASGALAGATAGGRGDGRVRSVVDIVQELPFRPGLLRGGGTAAAMAALPAACAARLRKHQWATLAWMLGEERSPWGLARHAWWQIPAARDVGAARADGCVFYGPLVRRFRRTLPRGDGWRAGGVVADVGGSGKTAVVAALVASAGPLGPQPPGRGRGRDTLVVTTVNSVATWKMELEAAGASVLVSTKKKVKKKRTSAGKDEDDAGEDPLARCDCVVAAYAQVERDAALGARPWHRVVFDSTTSGEGGGVCLRGGTPPFEALCRLDARRRWCLTSDLVPAHDREPLRHLARAIDGHLRLVGVSPAIREHVVKAAERRAAAVGDRTHSTEAGDLDLLLGALRPLCTRYTGGWGADRNAAASWVAEAAEDEWLAPDCDLAVTLSGDESARAHALEAECAAACAGAFPPWPAPPAAPGLKRLQAQATSLRRALGGGRYAAPPPATPGGGASTKEQPPDEEICAICRDELERPMQTPCAHWFCSECILTCLQVIVPPREDADGHMGRAGSSLLLPPPAKKARRGDRMVGRCPLCRSRVAERELKASVAPGDRAGRRSDADEGGGGPGVDDPVVFASKARALVRDIVDREAGRAESRGRPAKIVVFSQFHECLAWARREGLRDLGDFRVFHVERSMTLARRVEALAAWQRSGEASLLLVTAKSALSGVDLAGVTCCYFMEPCLSRHLERQLIGRVRAVTAHVVGLDKPDLGACLVKRLVTVGTVEERIADAGFPEGADTRQVMRALFPPAAGGGAP